MNIFQMKTKPHAIERIHDFLNDNFVCIGWPGIDNLEGLNKDEIRENIKEEYNLSGHRLGNALGQVNTFANTMKKGDVVFVVEKNMANIGIVGDYEYIEKYDNNIDGMCHRRPVEWKNKILISELPANIQKLLSNRNTICQYPEAMDKLEMDKYLNGKSKIEEQSLSKMEQLMSVALEVLEKELKSEDPDRRVKAATELLRFKNSNL